MQLVCVVVYMSLQLLFYREVKHMVDVLLTRLKFGSVAVQQSSVCAVYSSGISSGCVVDVGDQTISVGCIEEGVSNPNTRLVLNYGGNDVTRAFWWLINQSGYRVIFSTFLCAILVTRKH